MLISQLLENAAEEQYHKLKQLEKEVDAATEAGTIYKPDYESLKNAIDRTVERLAEKSMDKYFHGTGSTYYDIEEALGQLWYPRSARDILALKNKMARVKSEKGRATDMFKVLTAFYNEWKSLAEKIVALKAKIETAAQRKEVKNRAKAEEKAKKHVSSESLIKVLKEHMQEYIDRAVEMQKEHIEHLAKELKKVGWDLDKLHEQASWRQHGRDEHRRLTNNRSTYLNIFDVDSHIDRSYRNPGQTGEPHTKLKRSPKKEKHVLEATAAGAKASYLEWVDKMIDKIGKPVAKAKMDGNPWHGSMLDVETDDGEKQSWHTKMILNFSKYGTMFNQFPSLRKS